MKKIFAIFMALLCAAAVFAQEKPTVVIVPFDSKSVDAGETEVLFEVFQSEFANIGKAKVVDRSSLEKIRAQQKFQTSDWSNADKVAQLGKALNASMVVTGQLMMFKNQIVATIKVIDVNTTEIVSSVVKRASDTSVLFDKLAGMARQLAKDAFKTDPAGNLTLQSYLEKIGEYKELSEKHGSVEGGTYVSFGVFPQTKKADDVEITDKSESFNNLSCYQGSDGAWYVKKYYYFKIEPIKWRVLTNDYQGKKLLLAENILIAKNFYAKSNNYKNSYIRSYLNTVFFNMAFTKSQQLKIAVANVDNSANSTTDTNNKLQKAEKYACENTSDKIFLLSRREATTRSYGFAKVDEYDCEDSRIRITTDYAREKGAYQSSTHGLGGWWWLRSPIFNENMYCACNIFQDGNPTYSASVDEWGGVVPALTVTQ